MPSAIRATNRRPGFLLHETSHLLRREFDRRVEEAGLGLSRAQWLILRQVVNRPGCRQRDVAGILRLEAATVGRHVERLCAGGWLDRRDDPRDGRAYRLRVRPKARRALARLKRLGSRMREDYFAGIPAPRREAFIDDLLVIRRNLLACRVRAQGRSFRHDSDDFLQAAR